MNILILFFVMQLNGKGILKRLRDNVKIETSKFQVQIEIKKGKRKLFKEFNGYSRGKDFYIAFTNPEDRGVKYLKIKNDLYIYIPDIDDVVRISGDMLKQSFMGTDLSYEDLMEEDPLRYYKPLNVRDTIFNGHSYYILEIIDTTGRAPYYREKIIVDKKNIVAKKEELFTKSGRKIKEVEVLEYKKIGKKLIPSIYIMRDLRRKDSYTKVIFKDITIGIRVPVEVFNVDYLRK